MRPLAPIVFALLVLTGSAAGSVSRSAANDRVFRDAAGEDALAPDIGTVSVSNDDEGLVTFRIATPNRPALREDLRLSIYLDTDDDTATGLAPNGMDVRLLYDVYLHGDPTLWLLRCGKSVCSSLGGTKIPLRYAGGPTFTIDSSELGDTRRFRFWIAAMDGVVFDPVARTFDLANAHGDTAPREAASSWEYNVRIGPSRLLVERFATTPVRPAAGKAAPPARGDAGRHGSGGHERKRGVQSWNRRRPRAAGQSWLLARRRHLRLGRASDRGRQDASRIDRGDVRRQDREQVVREEGSTQPRNFRYRAHLVRRPVILVLLAAGLVGAGSAGAALPGSVSGRLTIEQLRDHRILVPSRPGVNRTTVIVRMGMEPLAARTADRTLFSSGARRKLNVASSSSKAHLARLAAAQERAVATLRREIPEATVSRRYRILLNGLAVKLPAWKLQHLMRLGFVEDVYPSVGYTLSLNKAPSIIGGPALRAATGVGGTGVKVGVVDDGVDPRHPFLDPGGMSFPAGFPKGTPGFTTPKVVAARAFFPENSTSESRQPLDEATSFHGTFVAGVIGGVENTTAPASVPTTCVASSGGCHGRITGLAGVAPRVHIGNYRVFSQPAPLGGCCSANTPEIIAAFEAAVADGMDVINFSGGGPQSDPARDPMVQVVTNVVRAGVVPVISAGNDRDLFGLGTVGSPSTAPDAISVAATANSHVFTRGLTLTAPGGLGQMPFVPAPGNIPFAWTNADQQIADVGTITGTNGSPVSRQLCGNTLPARSLAGVIALASRGGCSFEAKGRNASTAGALGLILADDRAGDPTGIPFNLGVPGGMISDLDGARIRQAVAGSGGRGASA